MNKKTGQLAAKFPTEINLKKDRNYAWCACGKSKNQPFCDGSHSDTEFKPIIFKVDVDQTVTLCNCKQTNNPPYCDGSHNNLKL